MVRAFLIGAGATRAQYEKAPLNHDFFKLLIRKNKILYEHIADFVEPHLEKIIPPPAFPSLFKVSVEDVMELSYNFPESIRTAFLESLYTTIYELLAETTQSDETTIKSIEIGNTTKRGPTLFKTLLNQSRLKDEDFFMTLNYDLYLDREILSAQGNIDYGVSSELLAGSPLPLNFNKMSPLSLYHLHGSLNWALQKNNKIFITRWAVNPHYSRKGSNLCLIPPGKKELNPILDKVWSTAKRRLLQADELIIIGCSLNPKDSKLIELVKKFIDVKGIEKVKIIYLEDSKNPSNNPEYTKTLGKGFKVYPHGFIYNGPRGKPGAIEFIFDNKKF